MRNYLNEDTTLTREDFDDYEDWARHCHEGGIVPFDPDDADPPAGGFYAALTALVWTETPNA